MPGLAGKVVAQREDFTHAATIGPVPCPVGDMGEEENEVLMLRQAIAETDWDTVESHGGFNAVVKKILQWERKNPASQGARIDRQIPPLGVTPMSSYW